MAEFVNAFKSKYTGEQIDELLDVLSSGSLLEPQAKENQYYSTESPNFLTESLNSSSFIQTCKNGIMTIDFNGIISSYYSYNLTSNIISTLQPNAIGIFVVEGTIVYTFDVPVNIKRINFSDHQQAGCTLYYYKDDSWISVGKIGQGATTLDLQNVQQLKVEMNYNSLGYSRLQYCIFDFVSDNYVTGMTIKDGTL